MGLAHLITRALFGSKKANKIANAQVKGAGLIAAKSIMNNPTSKAITLITNKKKDDGPKTVYDGSPFTNIDYSSLASDYSGGSGGGSGGGYSSRSRVPDISGLLAAYDQQADASRKIAQNSYDTTRNDLLTSLKRFQEQNAKDVENQKQGYLAEQSGLDYAREQANRQNRVAASARGLGGSGLQQLAQLQTLMSQGEDISQAAASNQKAMDNLRAVLQQKEDDYNTNLSKAQSTLDSTLAQIEANLAQQKAQAIYENEMAKVSGGSSGGSGSSGGFDASLANILDSYNAELGSLAGKSNQEVYDYVTSKYGERYGAAKGMGDVRTILGRAYTDDVGQYFNNKTSSSTYNATKNAIASMVGGLKGQGSKAAKKAAKKTTKKKKK